MSGIASKVSGASATQADFCVCTCLLSDRRERGYSIADGVVMEATEFVWMFPCYILARNYAFDVNGELILDNNIRFVTPEITDGGPRGIGIFTDSDLAESFLNESVDNDQLALLKISTPSELARFLRSAQGTYRYIVIDKNRKTQVLRYLIIREVISELEKSV
ncbi:MAG: hypothetical protein O2955_19370 [Planctomycetota bacterium]|nr:hypothetical protein [Planctomycetota bacterium]MDA1214675.1 hypothetical protein [Planctomycetota bacterium]